MLGLLLKNAYAHVGASKAEQADTAKATLPDGKLTFGFPSAGEMAK
jgi:hypothetical protein